MGFFERLFGKRQEAARSGGETFRLLSGYTPVFTNWRGSIYESELIRATLDLITIQNKSVEESAKNSATYRFMATLSNFAKDEDIAKERSRFDRDNFQNGGGGVLIFPNTYKDIKQVTAQQYALNADQAKLIKANVYDYFGVNEDVIQNKAYGDAWSAFYEGAIEWLAINLSETITRMLFTQRERAFGSQIFFASNRMQYMSNADKLNVAAQMADRGLMTRNEIRAIFNLPPLEGAIGDSLPARGEYYNVNEPREEAMVDAGQNE